MGRLKDKVARALSPVDTILDIDWRGTALPNNQRLSEAVIVREVCVLESFLLWPLTPSVSLTQNCESNFKFHKISFRRGE